MRAMGLLGIVKALADHIHHSDVLDVKTKQRMLERAVADANDLRPSVSEFDASRADETIADLKEMLGETA